MIKKILLLSVVVLVAGYLYKQSQLPPKQGSAAYWQAHGAVKGQDYTINVGDTAFFVPKHLPSKLFSNGEIVAGEVDVLTVYLDVSAFVDQTQQPVMNSRKQVRVEYRDLGPGNPKGRRFDASDPKWEKVVENKSLGLTEYHRKNKGGWGTINFVPMDATTHNSIDDELSFSCTPNPVTSKIDMCWGAFRYPSGLGVWFFIHEGLIPHWHDVFKQVISTTNNITNKNELR